MFRICVIICLLPASVMATSFSGPSYGNGYPLPGFDTGYGVPSLGLKDCVQRNVPVYTGTPLAPGMSEDLMDSINTLPANGDMTQEEAKEVLSGMMEKFKDPTRPVFIDPKTGRPVLVGDLNSGPKKSEDRPDVLKGCVSRTKTVCTGTGKDRTCETVEWEVCVSSD